MKETFTLLAAILGLIGVLGLFASLFLWNLPIFLSSVVAIVNAYAWAAVGDMADQIKELRRKSSQKVEG